MSKRPQIVYLSGPMTGLPDYNRPAFFAAEKRLRSLGHQVSNPARQTVMPLLSRWDYLGVDFMTIEGLNNTYGPAACAMAHLPGWDKSLGSLMETAQATFYEWRIFDVDELLPTEE